MKAYSDSDAEIKRVWVDPDFRGNHIASEMMDRIERKAMELGFRRTILQTRPIMKDAVAFYLKRGYHQIENYPPYDQMDGWSHLLCKNYWMTLYVCDEEQITNIFLPGGCCSWIHL